MISAVSRQRNEWSLVDSKIDAREPKLIGSRRYNSTSSTGTGIAGQSSDKWGDRRLSGNDGGGLAQLVATLIGSTKLLYAGRG